MRHLIKKSKKDLPKGIWRDENDFEIEVLYLDLNSDCYRVYNHTIGGNWWEPRDHFSDGTLKPPTLWSRLDVATLTLNEEAVG